jgi:hypothetical protein
MDKRVTELDVTTLERLYKKEIELLNRSLLSGVSWEALADQRWRVTQLAVILHKKLATNSDPSSSNTRKHR